MNTKPASLILPTQSLLPRFVTSCIKGAQYTIWAGFLSLALLSPATAADFSGNLKGVSITDAQGANQPPTAAFTYTISGDTITFDAGGSSDPDGTISQYKWDFGDASTSTGPIASHKFSDGKHVVTLTIVDNDSGISIRQNTINYSKGIQDIFNSDSSSTYSVINGGISISNGASYGLKPWTRNYVYHQASTGSNDHYVQADIQFTSSESSGLILRYTGSNGYLVDFDSAGRLCLTKLSGASRQSIGKFPKLTSLSASTPHTVRVEVSGNTFHALVDSIDTGTLTDSTYIGQYVGLAWNRGSANTLQPIDNFSGGAL